MSDFIEETEVEFYCPICKENRYDWMFNRLFVCHCMSSARELSRCIYRYRWMNGGETDKEVLLAPIREQGRWTEDQVEKIWSLALSGDCIVVPSGFVLSNFPFERILEVALSELEEAVRENPKPHVYGLCLYFEWLEYSLKHKHEIPPQEAHLIATSRALRLKVEEAFPALWRALGYGRFGMSAADLENVLYEEEGAETDDELGH